MAFKYQNTLITGLDNLNLNPNISKGWGRCAIVCNHASVSQNLEPSPTVVKKILEDRLVCLFSPQHGYYGTVQDNMIETQDSLHPTLKIPIYSLYSNSRIPNEEQLKKVDTIIFDLQITGCRIYTWKSTLHLVLCQAAKLGKKVVVFDRPNPVGGVVTEGRCLDLEWKSFVGYHAMPMRHGLTAGEAAKYFSRDLDVDLSIVEMKSWDRNNYWDDYNDIWLAPSPNLPTFESVLFYPGLVMLEGTNLSEGRGTCLPFQLVGAPYLKSASQYKKRILDYLGSRYNSEFMMLDAEFMPTSGKWAGEICYGIQLKAIRKRDIRSFDLCIAMIKAAIDIGGSKFEFKKPPYEYEYDEIPMKFIFGHGDICEKLADSKISIADEYWHLGKDEYWNQVKPFLMYDDSNASH